ncbi:hypothetical protein VB740_10525, partial [Nostoc sp. UHCC 0251]|nr:hypothetical protein [Nostoc sp. UHCC 0251]
VKVPLFKGDLGGSKTFDTANRTFQTSSKSLSRLASVGVVNAVIAIAILNFWSKQLSQTAPIAKSQ